MDIRIIGVDHRVVGLLEGVGSFGFTQFLGALLIWGMLAVTAGDRVFANRVLVPLSLLSAVFWGVTQYPRGSSVEGCLILGVVGGLAVVVAGKLCNRLLRYARERT